MKSTVEAGITHPLSMRNPVYLFALLLTASGSLYLVFGSIINHEFLNWDDKIYIVDNPHLRYLSIDNLIWMLTDYKTINWHPLTWLSLSIDLSIYGENPFALKLTNIVIHLSTCIILFFLFKTVLEAVEQRFATNNFPLSKTARKYTSFFAVCIFAIHPQHIESIIWVSERKDVLCGFFYFSALLFYLKYRTNRISAYFFVALIFALLAALSKPMAVSLPLTLIILDILVPNLVTSSAGWQKTLRILFINKSPFIAISALTALLTLLAQNAAIKDLSTIGIIPRLINASEATLHYLSSILLPVHLSPFYPYSDISLHPTLISILPVIGVLTLVFACVKLWKRGYHLFLVSLAFYAVTILPVIGIVSVGHQAYADRYTYIPTSLFYLALSHGIAVFLSKYNYAAYFRYIAAVMGFLAFVTFAMTSAVLVNYWKNDETLWTSVATLYPGKVYLAHQNLGNVYLVDHRYTDAIREYKTALKIDPRSSKTHENLGRAYGYSGNKDAEIKQYLLAIQENSSSIWPLLFAGYFYLSDNNLALAAKYFEQALRLAPQSPPAVLANAKVAILSGDSSTAKTLLGDLLKKHSRNKEAIWLLIQVYNNEGRYRNVRTLLERLLMNDNSNKQAREMLLQIQKLGY